MERQLVTRSGDADKSHLARYYFAADRVRGTVIDAACGCGYGTNLLSRKAKATGIDIEPTAIAHAKKYFNGDFICMDAMDVNKIGRSALEDPIRFDTVVSFETIEHVKDAEGLLERFREIGNELICSVPNELLYKFNNETFYEDKYPHLRHYTPDEFDALLMSAGWVVTGRYCQESKFNPVIREGVDGRFLVYTAK